MRIRTEESSPNASSLIRSIRVTPGKEASVAMTSTHALELTARIIQNDLNTAVPLIYLLDAFLTARKDPTGEIMAREVLRFLYTKTEDCETALAQFIEKGNATDLTLVA